MAIRRIGQIFVDMGFIDDDQLEMLLEEQQQQPGEKLGKIVRREIPDVGAITFVYVTDPEGNIIEIQHRL